MLDLGSFQNRPVLSLAVKVAYVMMLNLRMTELKMTLVGYKAM